MSSSSRSGVSLLEIVLAISIFSVAVVPIISLFTQVNRTSYAANRLLDATLHGQLVLDAILELETSELPTMAATERRVLFDEAGGFRASGGPRWDEIVTYLAVDPPFTMVNRVVIAETFGDPGKIVVTIELRWRRIAHEAANERMIRLRGTSNPRGWQ